MISAARFLSHELAIFDDGDSLGADLLIGGFSLASFLVRSISATERNGPVAELGLFHVGAQSGDERQGVRRSVRLTILHVKKPLARQEEVIMSRKKISRNAPCPCGSGKKYKKCC